MTRGRTRTPIMPVFPPFIPALCQPREPTYYAGNCAGIIASSIILDKQPESDPCWGWFGSGAETIFLHAPAPTIVLVSLRMQLSVEYMHRHALLSDKDSRENRSRQN